MPTFVKAIFGGEDVKDPHKYPWIVKITPLYVYKVKEYTPHTIFHTFDNIFHVYNLMRESKKCKKFMQVLNLCNDFSRADQGRTK